jgi:DNA repair and recombination protein RAD52
LKDGTSREDIGFGSSENQRSKSQAYEKAKKEAATDALKRALRQLGDCLGNCCYDKEFLRDIKKITKQKAEGLDPSKLLRKIEFTSSEVFGESQDSIEPSFEINENDLYGDDH